MLSNRLIVLNCLKQDLQDEQDLQDYAVLPVTNPLGLEELHVYSLPNFFLQKTSTAAIINDSRVEKALQTRKMCRKPQK